MIYGIIYTAELLRSSSAAIPPCAVTCSRKESSPFKTVVYHMKKDNKNINDTSEFGFVVDPEENKSVFVRSLEDITADELGPAKPKKKLDARHIFAKAFYLAVMLVCICVLAWGAYTLVQGAHGYIKGEKLYTDLAESFKSDAFHEQTTTDSNEPVVRSSAMGKAVESSLSMSDIRAMKLDNIDINVSDEVGEAAQYKAKLEWLRQINPDIYGWITIEGCDVDYPVVRGDDNAYYLDHAYTGEYMIVGSVFADYRTNDKIINNYNTVLYGHNMENGSMFHAVELMYEDEDLFDTSRIFMYTTDGIYEYAPISVYKTDAYDQYFRMRFKSVGEFTDFASERLEKSVWKRTAEFSEYDRLLTLSTCTNEEYSGRYALHARLIDVEVFE